jgi:hypothetical protein
VVDHLFREKNLKIPREPQPSADTGAASRPPKPPAKPKPAPAPPETTALISRPRPEVVEKVDEEETSGSGGGSFWERLGGALVEAFAEHLDRKVDELRDAADHEQRLVSETPNITGDWYSPNGGVFTFSQLGSLVRVEGSAAGISLSGRGQIRGKSIRIQGFSLGGGPFQAGLAVSADGQKITGQIVDGFGRSSPVQLHR